MTDDVTKTTIFKILNRAMKARKIRRDSSLEDLLEAIRHAGADTFITHETAEVLVRQWVESTPRLVE